MINEKILVIDYYNKQCKKVLTSKCFKEKLDLYNVLFDIFKNYLYFSLTGHSFDWAFVWAFNTTTEQSTNCFAIRTQKRPVHCN